MRALVILLCFAPALSGAFVRHASACTCGDMTVAEQRRDAKAVFLGEVVSKRKSEAVEEDGVEVTLKVERVWNGRVPEQAVVHTGPTDDLYPFASLCATPFVVGERYLVFSYGREKLATNVSAGSGAFPYAEKKLKQLGKGRPPLKSKSK